MSRPTAHGSTMTNNRKPAISISKVRTGENLENTFYLITVGGQSTNISQQLEQRMDFDDITDFIDATKKALKSLIASDKKNPEMKNIGDYRTEYNHRYVSLESPFDADGMHLHIPMETYEIVAFHKVVAYIKTQQKQRA